MSSHGGGSRRRRHEEHEEHENHERWLVTYADMVTLLMVLFIVMFAMSQVDERKYAQLKEGLAAGFGESDSILTGSESIQSQPGTAAVAAVAPQLNVANLDGGEKAAVAEAIQQAAALELQRSWEAAEKEIRRFEEVRRKLLEALRRRGLEGDVTTTYDERGLVVSLVSRHVVFEADLATLSLRGQQVVDALAPVLRSIEAPLQIDGHTNQVPVKPRYFATDWDLSAARAVTVLRRLEEQHGLPASRLAVAGYGHTRPLVDPGEPGSQEINKRVDIVVLTGLPPQDAAHLEDAAKAFERAGGDEAALEEALTDAMEESAQRRGQGRTDRPEDDAEISALDSPTDQRPDQRPDQRTDQEQR